MATRCPVIPPRPRQQPHADIRPYPLTPSIPYPTPMPTHTPHPLTLSLPVLSLSKGRRVMLRPSKDVSGDRTRATAACHPRMRVQGSPCCLQVVSHPPFSAHFPIWTLFRGCSARGLSPICRRRLNPATAKQPPSYTPLSDGKAKGQFQAAPHPVAQQPRFNRKAVSALRRAASGTEGPGKTREHNSMQLKPVPQRLAMESPGAHGL